MSSQTGRVTFTSLFVTVVCAAERKIFLVQDNKRKRTRTGVRARGEHS